MFVINLFGFVMITSTIVIGVIFYSKATAIEKEIELEILAKSISNSEEGSDTDYDLSDSAEVTQNDDDANQHSSDDQDDREEEDTTV